MQPALTSDESLHWLALRMAAGVGTRRAGRLVEIFRTPQAIFRASASELEAAGLSPAVAQSVASGCAFEEAVEQQEKVAKLGVVLVPITDSRYPARLREIFDPPPLLYARGRVELLGHLMLGVVGTRRPTAYGMQVAERLSKDLSEAGLTIASGMARGIDTAAHRAVLECEGDTIAVFGCGVDEVYPSENRKLAERLSEKGLVISEFPMGAPPFPQNFPVRNRIISGMSAGVLVVEGGEYSGSTITAKLASEQNREMFAVPGNVTSKMSWGPNLLIKQGAKLVQEWNDVVMELKAEDRRKLVEQCRNRLIPREMDGGESKREGPASDLSSHSSLILRALKHDGPVGLDALIDAVEGLDTPDVIAALFELELSGLVRQLPGKSYIKVWAE
ncbi:MAG: DNA-processing protein DprA [Bryobacteraceae bacterium]